MDKISNCLSNKTSFIKNQSKNKSLIINPIYFSIEIIPYNKILSNIMICLQKKLSPKIFNEIYKYFIKEVKKYMNTSSSKILIPKEATPTNTKTVNNLQNNNKNHKLKKEKEKKSKPVVGLPYPYKFEKFDKIENLKSKKNISFSNFSNLNFNYINIKKFYNNFKYPNYSNNPLNKTNSNIKSNNSNSEEKDFLYKKNQMALNNNKFTMNEKLPANKIVLNNYRYNTINTSIHQNNDNNYRLKKIKIPKNNNNENKSQHISNNTRKKIRNNRTLKNLPHQTFLDIITKNNKYKTNNNSNIKSTTLLLNNGIFSKEKDKINQTMGLIGDNKKLKIINIKLQKPIKNGGKEMQNSLQTSEDMLKNIKNSLDDDNLKGMLNFSYENFLSKESERESREYSIEE